MKWLAAVGVGCSLGIVGAVPIGLAGSQARAAAIPAGCVAHGALGAMPDVPGDYRCGGLMLNWHSSGPGASPHQIWAGRWLFRDTAGRLRFGSCTFNRGVHPTIDATAVPTAQSLRRDPSRAKSGYLLWRYRSADNLTLAAMWVVFHFYAGDAAGSNRSSSPSSPLVPSLDKVAEYSGNGALERRAKQLDEEASAYAARWVLSLDRSGTSVVAVVRSGDRGVANVVVTFTAHGWTAEGTTDGDGRVTVDAPTDRAVTAKASAPGSPGFVTGAPAWGTVPQVLITRGPTKTLTASVDPVGPSPTDPPATTPPTDPPATTPPTDPPATTPPGTTPPTEPPGTTPPPTTPAPTSPSTTMATVAPTEPPSTTPDTNPPPTTPASSSTSTSTTAAPVATNPPDTAPPPIEPPPGGGPPLPQTGAPTDGMVTYLALAFLVGGVGLLGTLRRTPKPAGRGWEGRGWDDGEPTRP